MKIDTEHFDRCINTAREAFSLLETVEIDSTSYDIYRTAAVKAFEMTLELAGKLLRKVLKPYFSSPKTVDRLSFKDLFRHAAKHDIIDLKSCERWLSYRDNRNTTAHDYGEGFGNVTLSILPQFICDAEALSEALKKC